MHRWSYNELRRRTVFIPKHFLNQMANSRSAGTFSPAIRSLQVPLKDMAAFQIGWPFESIGTVLHIGMYTRIGNISLDGKLF